MPKIVTPLTVTQVKNAKPKDKQYKLADGKGLALWVRPNGGKYWIFVFYQNKKQKTLSIGTYPEISLAEAREARDELRKKLALGEDIQKRDKPSYHLINIINDWYERWSVDAAPKYAKQVLSNFNRWIIPRLGDKDIRTIKTVDIVETLRTMEARGIADTLRKTKNSLGLVFGFAMGSGIIDYNPVTQIRNNVFKKPTSRNMTALKPVELARLIDFLEQRGEFQPASNRLKLNEVTRLAIYWLLLTMTRVQETACAEWSEIDLDAGVWLIPAEKKKERREHVVPLSSAMIWVLNQAKAVNVNGRYLFESYNFKSHINKESPRVAMQRAGLDTTAHGLRSLARTYLREELKINDDVAEKLLAHSLGTKVQTAYNRSELIHERREALEKWGNTILNLIEFKSS